MKHDGLEVRLRPCAEQTTYIIEFGLNSKAEGDADKSPNTGACVIASPNQPFEVCVSLEAAHAPYSAEVVAVEIETRSALKRESKEMEIQTWSIPLGGRGTASKNNRGLEAEFVKEYCFSTYTFWTRDKSPSKFSAVSYPFLVPQIGERITVRLQRGKLPRSEILPCLPMREHDTNPASAPREAELEGPTVIDKRWFKRTGGRNGHSIEFVFKVCGEDYATRTRESRLVEVRCASSPNEADDCDDDESHCAVMKTEEQSLTTEDANLTMTTDRTTERDQVSPRPAPILLQEAGQDVKAPVESALPADPGCCTLRPREEATKVNYTSHPIDQYIDPPIETSITEDQAEMLPAPQNIGYAQFYSLDHNGQPIKKRGRPRGWKKAEHSREAHGLEPYPKKPKPTQDGRRKDKSSATESKATEQQPLAMEKPPEEINGSSQISSNSDAHKENELSQEPLRDKANLKARKKAKLTLELKAVELKEERLRIEREILELEE